MEATPTQIINYFSGFKQNLVPLFQRPYTWGERQWRTLWEDILAFYGLTDGDSKSTHFMGAVVTMLALTIVIFLCSGPKRYRSSTQSCECW